MTITDKVHVLAMVSGLNVGNVAPDILLFPSSLLPPGCDGASDECHQNHLYALRR